MTLNTIALNYQTNAKKEKRIVVVLSNYFHVPTFSSIVPVLNNL